MNASPQPVSFLKGREHAPRLSQPYVAGKRSPRFWTDDERAIIAAHYEAEGPFHCLGLLPGKTLGGIYRQASLMGLSAPARAERRERIGTSLDEAIAEAWPLLKGRGAVSALAARLGVKRDAVSRRALALGLTIPHKKEPRWTEAEEALLRRAPVNNPDRASAFFAAHGYSRSPASITVRCRRIELSRRRKDVLSAVSAAKILGVDGKTVSQWLRDGDIPAERRGSKRTPQQGGDSWAIQPSDLRRFVLDHLDRIDIRKADKLSFVALIAGELDNPAERPE